MAMHQPLPCLSAAYANWQQEEDDEEMLAESEDTLSAEEVKISKLDLHGANKGAFVTSALT